MRSDTGPTGGVRAGMVRRAWPVIVAIALLPSLAALPAASGVGPTATTLTVGVAPTTIVYGSYVRVSGRLMAGSTGVPGRPLIVEYKAAGSSTFVAMGSVSTLEPGTYVVAVRPTSTGVLRVRFAGDAGYAAGTSSLSKVTVKVDPYMYSGTRIVRLGRSQTIGVRVLPSHRRAKVTIFRRVGRRWVRWATGRTNSSSRFGKVFRPTRRGTMQWRAFVAGDGSHASNYSRPIKTSCQVAPRASQRPGDGVGPNLTSASVLPGAISPDGNGIDDSATFKFRTSEAGKATAGVYTVSGRLIRKLAGWQSKNAGYCTYVWNGKNDSGSRVADDVYVFKGYALDRAGNFSNPYPVQASVRVGLGHSRSWSALRRISQAQFNRYVEEFSTAQGADGSLHVVWHEGVAVAYKKLDRYGNTVINTVRIPDVSTEHSKRAYPGVAVAADGSATVFWREYHGPGEDSSFARQMDAAGRMDRPFEYLYSDAARYSEVSMDASGNMHTITLNGNYQPTYAMYDGDLIPLSGRGPLTWDVTTQGNAGPSLVAEPNGTAHAAWFCATERTTSPYRYQIDYSKIGYGPGRGADDSRSVNQLVTSRPLGYAEDVDDTNTGGLSRSPSIDVDADGNAHVAWAHNGRHVSYVKIGASGSIVVRETTVAADIGVNNYPTWQARLRARSDGGADIVFPRTLSAPSPSTRLAHLRVNSSGIPVSTPVTITPTGVHPRGLCMTRLDNDLRVVFTGEVPFASANDRLFYLDQTNNPQAFDKTRPDLMVDDAHSSNGSPPKEGQSVGMSVQVSNCGWVTSTASSAEWWFGSTTFAVSYIPPLGVDAIASIGATWTMPANYDSSPAWIKVKVDPANRIAETSENNNETMHRVPVRLRPVGTSVYARCTDETFDEAREGGYGVHGIEATITGTIGAGEPGAGTSITRHVTGDGGFTFWDVRPGAYDITASATGYLPSRIATHVVVSRSAADPYSVTITPGNIAFWFNQWAELTGRCTTDGANGGIGGVKADVTALGKSALSASGGTPAASGTYTVTKLFEGSYKVTFTKDGYKRVTTDVVLPLAGTAVKNAEMPATTVGYVDVTVTNEVGTPMAGQTVTLHKSSDNAQVDTKVTDGNGQCTFEPTAGVSYYAKAARTYYVTVQQTVNVSTAGHVYPVTLTMELDRSAVYAKSSQLAMISWVEHEKTLLGGDAYVLWGNYWTKVGVQYAKLGDTWHVLGLDATVKGNPSYLSLLRPSVKIPTGGPVPLPSQLTIPDLSDTYSNVRVDRVELVNAATGQVYWRGSDYDAPWYSNSPSSRQQTRSWPSETAPWPEDGIAVGTGDNWAVKIWVRVGNQNNSRPETQYWASAPILEGYKNDYMVITYYPASSGTRFNPMGRPMYIDKVHSGYPGW